MADTDDLTEDIVTAELPGDVVVRSMDRREIDVRIVPWDTVIATRNGLESFRPGSFSHVDPRKVVIRLEHQDPAAGRGVAIEERADGPHMTFRVSKTPRGDEILTLADDGVTAYVSVGYRPNGTEGETVQRGGRRHTQITKVNLAEVSTTWNPAYPDTAVLAVRSEGDTPMATEAETPAAQPEPDYAPVTAIQTSQSAMLDQLRQFGASNERVQERVLDRLEKLETRARQDIIVPGQPERRQDGNRTGHWVKLVLRQLTGERVSDLETRVLADLITTDNLGVVPDAFSDELIGVIDPSRPFLQTTRELPTPDSGLTLTVPVLVTRPTVGVQAAEKDDIASTTTSITTTGFDAVTVAGGGDISIQLLKRSSPSYLDLYLRLLAEAYAAESETLAVATLLDSGVTPGSGYIDPEDLEIGESWTNAVTVSKLLRPDHIWLSTRAIQEFIDAKASGTNAPLYSNLAADITVGGGAGGRISGLVPVYVPALDGSGADVVIGPSRGFAWAEDGTFTLQVDVPSKAGRDVAIVGILWFAPLYPAAFTTYRFAS